MLMDMGRVCCIYRILQIKRILNSLQSSKLTSGDTRSGRAFRAAELCQPTAGCAPGKPEKTSIFHAFPQAWKNWHVAVVICPTVTRENRAARHTDLR
ncbi:MAG: hypothetical protein REI94_11725 [Moraxellaceae bacterium]|nr:hypothetical protein [Moraxellaceae bacterium]